jgi:tRNA(Ile)-lysidine synthase
MSITTNHLLTKLQSLTSSKKLLIAYSGGLDSHVLLHALAPVSLSQGFQVRAIYIDHGLQSVAKRWSQHCLAICENLSIDCNVMSLALDIPQGESLEAVAREARYQAFSQTLQADEVLLTAHHQDDQAETVLIQLFRGAGINGLAAMPVINSFGKGQHIRPLLDQSRGGLDHYAQQYQLDFIEDPSNQDQRYDRNFFRHAIIPRLKKRWMSMSAVLARVAQHQAEAKSLLAEYIADDLPQLIGKRKGTLSIQKLKLLSPARCKAIIRYFLDQKGFQAPSDKKLRHIILDVLNAKQSAIPCVHWHGVEMRRYQDDLYAIKPLSIHDTKQVIPWDINQPLQIASLKRILEFKQLEGVNYLLLGKEQTVEVRFRQGGEKIYQAQGRHSKRLKKIFQERHIPTWERDRIPLIYIDNILVLMVMN